MHQHHSTYDILYTYHITKSGNVPEDLLDNWASKVTKGRDFSFKTGLLGLAWLIAYLIQEKIIEGDADEVLEDVDDVLYKLAIKEIVQPVPQVPQLLDYITYYQQRLKYTSKAHFYRRFTHFECMKLMLEKLNEFLLDAESSFSPDSISQYINVVLKHSYLCKASITESLIEKAFYPTVEKLINYFLEQKTELICPEELAKLHICVKQYDHPHWNKQIEDIYNVKFNHKKIENESEAKVGWKVLNECYPYQKIPMGSDFSERDRYNLYLFITNVKLKV